MVSFGVDSDTDDDDEQQTPVPLFILKIVGWQVREWVKEGKIEGCERDGKKMVLRRVEGSAMGVTLSPH